MLKRTILLADSPADADEFGPHSNIAGELAAIVGATEVGVGRVPRSIALVGDWGSGKSSIIKMLRSRLASVNSPKVRTFIYDAWSHEGDALRRAFLDSLRLAFESDISKNRQEYFRAAIWDIQETTSTTTSPVLRRHGKFLLFSLLLIPIGLRLLGSYPPGLSMADKLNWDAIWLFSLFSPFILSFLFWVVKNAGPSWLNQWLFRTSDKQLLRQLKVTDVLFHKIEGVVDKKSTTTPFDSIQQSRTTFVDICREIVGRQGRLVIVVDNLDRLERDDARAFWATMQAFFDRTGWGSDEVMGRVWLLVPFSRPAVSHIFSASEMVPSGEEAKAFIDKTFDLIFEVPPPIQVGLRDYLLRLLKSAFPEHEDRTLTNVRNLYDHHRSTGSVIGKAGDTSGTRRTPREMKIFVNQLVALYRTRGDDVWLETLAAYLLIKGRIEKDGLQPPHQLSGFQMSLLMPDIDPVQQLAAVHFGVTLPDAAQVVLADPIRTAISANNRELLESLSGRSGFIDVLEGAVSATDTDSVEGLFKKILLIHELPVAADPRLHTTWTRLIVELGTITKLGHVSPSMSEALNALRSRAYPNELAQIRQKLRQGLSTTWVGSPNLQSGVDADVGVEGGSPSEADSWVTLATKVLPVVEGEQPIPVPSLVTFGLQIVDAISSRPNALTIASGVSLRIDFADAETASQLVSWPGESWAPTDPMAFWQVVAKLADKATDWSAVTSGYARYLGQASEMASGAIRMLVAMSLTLDAPTVAYALKQTVDSGTFGGAVSSAADDVDAMAYAAAGIILRAPDSYAAIKKRAERMMPL